MSVAHVLVSTSSNYEPVYKFCKESLLKARRDVIIHENMMDLSMFKEENNDKNFQTDRWYYACKQKNINLHEFMIKHPDIEYVIASDADINYLNPYKLKDLVSYAKKHELDFYGMQENFSHAFNAGFFIIRNHGKCHIFIRRIIDELINKPRTPLADQDVLNRLIFQGNDIKHEFIPRDLYVWGHERPNGMTIFHHAVGVETLSDKIKQIIDVQNLYYYDNYLLVLLVLLVSLLGLLILI